MDQIETPPNITEPTPEASPAQGGKPENRLEHRHVNIKWLIIVFIIFFIIIAVFLIMHFNNQEATGQKEGIGEKPVAGLEIQETEPEQEQTSQQSPLTGMESQEVKPEAAYDALDECRAKGDINDRIACLESYNDPEIIAARKAECENLIGDEKTNCYDEYYYSSTRSSLDETYCEAIQDPAIKEECLSYN